MIPGLNRTPLDTGAVLAVLAASGHRVTEPRQAVLELIAEQDGPFTAAAIEMAALDRGKAIGRATVFRSLELLAGLGVVERLDLPSGDHAYVACGPAHHHHLVCTSCGRSTHVPDLGVGSVLDDVARRTGYRIERHRLELYGVCPGCQATAKRTAGRATAPAGGRNGQPAGAAT